MNIIRTLFFVSLTLVHPLWAHDDANSLLVDYREISMAMAKDNYEEALKAATKLEGNLDGFLEDGEPDPRRSSALEMRASVKRFSKIGTTQVDQLREAFSSISEAGKKLVLAIPNSDLRSKWTLYYCPMVKSYWIQASTDAQTMNPYMGLEMQQCGGKRKWPTQ